MIVPIYEYRCAGCHRKVSIFFRSHTAAAEPRCPRCGSAELERLFSRVVVRRGGRGDVGAEEFDTGGDGFDEAVGDEFGEPFGFPGSDLDEDADPREIARWTRQMSAQVGEPLDPDLDRALSDIERGADPEEVLDRLEEAGPPEAGGFDDEI